MEYLILWVYKEVVLQLLWKPKWKKLTLREISIIGGKKSKSTIIIANNY